MVVMVVGVVVKVVVVVGVVVVEVEQISYSKQKVESMDGMLAPQPHRCEI